MTSLPRFVLSSLFVTLIIAPITVGLPGCGSGEDQASPPAVEGGGAGTPEEDPPAGGGSGTNNY